MYLRVRGTLHVLCAVCGGGELRLQRHLTCDAALVRRLDAACDTMVSSLLGQPACGGNDGFAARAKAAKERGLDSGGGAEGAKPPPEGVKSPLPVPGAPAAKLYEAHDAIVQARHPQIMRAVQRGGKEALIRRVRACHHRVRATWPLTLPDSDAVCDWVGMRADERSMGPRHTCPSHFRCRHGLRVSHLGPAPTRAHVGSTHAPRRQPASLFVDHDLASADFCMQYLQRPAQFGARSLFLMKRAQLRRALSLVLAATCAST